jgi:hypothetical protein
MDATLDLMSAGERPRSTTLQLGFTARATEMLVETRGVKTTLHVNPTAPVPITGDRVRVATKTRQLVFEVIEREFQFQAKRIIIHITLDIPR